jgi:general secretion pathway protein K
MARITAELSPSTKMPMDTNGSNSQRGFVLIAALWLSALAVVVATEFTLRVRSTIALSSSVLQTSELSAIADGMVRLTAWRLATGKDIPLNGEQQLCLWKNKVVVATKVQDHGGLLDMNLAATDLLEHVFQAAGASPSQSTLFTTEMLDYRDVDLITPQGNNEPILRDGKANKNSPFDTVEELDLLPSMTDELY